MILIRNLRLTPGEREEQLEKLAARALGVEPGRISGLTIVKKSLDARKKSDIYWLYSVAVTVPDEKSVLVRGRNNVEAYAPFRYEIPKAASPTRPVVVGFGPAGMFAALVLAKAGAKPIVLERGQEAEKRAEGIRQSTDYYNKRAGSSSGSLASKANMVRDYNERHK